METFTILIIVGTSFTLIILGLAAFMILFSQRKEARLEVILKELELKRQKEITENTLKTQESEWQRIGNELHDDLGPEFAALRFKVDNMSHLIKSNEDEKAKQSAKIISKDLHNVFNKFSDISKVLYPSILYRKGVEQALKLLIVQANENSLIQFDGDIQMGKTEEIKRLTIYRVVQELITNAQKHSKASRVKIKVSEDLSYIKISYHDDGIGFNTKGEYAGLGWQSIRGRIDAIGGDLKVVSSENDGLQVQIDIPKTDDLG